MCSERIAVRNLLLVASIWIIRSRNDVNEMFFYSILLPTFLYEPWKVTCRDACSPSWHGIYWEVIRVWKGEYKQVALMRHDCEGPARQGRRRINRYRLRSTCSADYIGDKSRDWKHVIWPTPVYVSVPDIWPRPGSNPFDELLKIHLMYV